MISHTMHSSLLRVGVVFYRCVIVYGTGGGRAGCSVALGGGGVRLQLCVEARVTVHAGGLGVDAVA